MIKILTFYRKLKQYSNYLIDYIVKLSPYISKIG